MSLPDDDGEPDIVMVMLQRIREKTPALTDEAAAEIERAMRADFGGMRFRILKRGKYLTNAQKAQVFKDGLSGMPTAEVVAKHRTSQATLYRLMKKGGRFGS